MLVNALDGRVSIPAVADALARCRCALARRVWRLACGVCGHQMLMHYEADRLSLRCALCGRDTPGWELGRRVKYPQRVNARPSAGLRLVREDNGRRAA
jgi:hypothetical protein